MLIIIVTALMAIKKPDNTSITKRKANMFLFDRMMESRRSFFTTTEWRRLEDVKISEYMKIKVIIHIQ